MTKRVKVNGKTGNLKDDVSISSDKTKISVTCSVAFSKRLLNLFRYLKYLTKKYFPFFYRNLSHVSNIHLFAFIPGYIAECGQENCWQCIAATLYCWGAWVYEEPSSTLLENLTDDANA